MPSAMSAPQAPTVGMRPAIRCRRARINGDDPTRPVTRATAARISRAGTAQRSPLFAEVRPADAQLDRPWHAATGLRQHPIG